MISSVSGVLADRRAESVVIQTDGGIGYAVAVPLGVFERLPAQGARCSLHTELVIREDAWTLYGFDSTVERSIFQRLLGATGLGPRLPPWALCRPSRRSRRRHRTRRSKPRSANR